MEPPPFQPKFSGFSRIFGGSFFKFSAPAAPFFVVFWRLRRHFFCIFCITFAFSSSTRWHTQVLLRDFLPLWCSSSTTDLMPTGLNTAECTQLQWMEINQIHLGCTYSALVATFPTDTSILCLICVDFSSAAPAALHFTTIFPERRLRRLIFFRFFLGQVGSPAKKFHFLTGGVY